MRRFCVFSCFLIVTNATAVAGFENDYIWQDRFNEMLALAKTGDSSAQYTLGEMYEHGKGTHQDLNNALEWYKRAADSRNSKALYKLGYFHFTGVGVKQDYNKAYRYFQLPANKGNSRAQFYLAQLYKQGQGVSRDPQEALIWFSRASLGGYTPAREELTELKKEIERKKKHSAGWKRTAKKKVGKKTDKAAVPERKKTGINIDTVIGRLMQGGWVRHNKPADFLPSGITTCNTLNSALIECLSKDIVRKVGSADIVYKTKALIYDIKSNGNFEVAYRNNVLKIDRSKYQDRNAFSLPIKLGWQETEHRLQCSISGKFETNCLKNKVRKMTFNLVKQ